MLNAVGERVRAVSATQSPRDPDREVRSELATEIVGRFFAEPQLWRIGTLLRGANWYVSVGQTHRTFILVFLESPSMVGNLNLCAIGARG